MGTAARANGVTGEHKQVWGVYPSRAATPLRATYHKRAASQATPHFLSIPKLAATEGTSDIIMRDCRTTLLATVNAELAIWSVEWG